MRSKRGPWSLIPFLVVGAAVAVLADGPAEESSGREPAAEPAAGETPAEDTASPEAPASAPGQAGMRAFLDPETGQLMSRPPDDETAVVSPSGDRPQPGHWLNTYSTDLFEEAVPAGGYKVDLRGRFQSAVVATIDPESNEVDVDCVVIPVDEEDGDER